MNVEICLFPDIWKHEPEAVVAGRTEITRIRVEGEGEHDEKTVINTEQFAKIEYMEVNQNEDTGEFVTPEVFNWMMLIAQRYV